MSSIDDALNALAAIAKGQAPTAQSGPSASQALGGNFVDGKTPMVYWGSSSAVVHQNTSGRDSSQESVDKALGIRNRAPDATMTLQNAVADWYNWSDQERAAFAKRAYSLGMTSDPNDLYGSSGAFNAWQNAVQQASNFYTFANRKVTPWQAMDLMVNGGMKPKTTTSTSFNIPTVEDAHAATRNLFQALMGRDPDQNELDRYASMMSTYAQKHPATVKQTTDIHGNQTTTKTGGYTDAAMGDVLSQQAKQDPEYGSYQAATTYWNALMQAMGSGGNG